jgi:hypothetical protein
MNDSSKKAAPILKLDLERVRELKVRSSVRTGVDVSCVGTVPPPASVNVTVKCAKRD